MRVELAVGSSNVESPIKAYCKKQNLQKSIDRFTKSMVAAKQPYGRVNDFLAFAASREQTKTTTSSRRTDPKSKLDS